MAGIVVSVDGWGHRHEVIGSWVSDNGTTENWQATFTYSAGNNARFAFVCDVRRGARGGPAVLEIRHLILCANRSRGCREWLAFARWRLPVQYGSWDCCRWRR